jgi:hypothetical protein
MHDLTYEPEGEGDARERERAARSAPPMNSQAQAIQLQRRIGNKAFSKLFGSSKRKDKEAEPAAKDSAPQLLVERSLHAISDVIRVATDVALAKAAGEDASGAASRMQTLLTKAKTDLVTAVSALQRSGTRIANQGVIEDVRWRLARLNIDSSVHALPLAHFKSAFTAQDGPLDTLVRLRFSLHRALSLPESARVANVPFDQRVYGDDLRRDDMYWGEMDDSTRDIVDLILLHADKGWIGPGEGQYASVKDLMMREFNWSQEEIARYLGDKAFIPRVKAMSDDERAAAEVTENGSKLARRTPSGLEPFSTVGWYSKFQGRDFGIWVMDQAGRIYSGEHKVGLFHHSTFLRGGNVAAAGEWKVSDDGTLEYITNKSGHYKPQPQHLRAVLEELDRRQVTLTNVTVKVISSSDLHGTVQSEDAAGWLAKQRGPVAPGADPLRDDDDGSHYGLAPSFEPHEYAKTQGD